MVAIVFDDPASKLGRPGGPLASSILIFVTLSMSYTRIVALCISPIASPTANLVMDSLRATIGNTRAISLRAIIELIIQALRIIKLLGSIVCRM
uniref:Uncharacterized protein n=1 Tax=Arundo donax TaxID=35708 RepID=A0A0A9D5G0_ARUDO